MEAKDPEGLANLEPRGIVGMIYVGDHQALLYTKYISCNLMVMEKKIFLSLSMRAIDPHVHDKFSPNGLDWQALCRGPLDILNIQDTSCFLCFFPL